MRNVLCIEHFCSRFFHAYGLVAYKIRYFLIICPLLVAMCLSPNLPHLIVVNSMRDTFRIFSAPNDKHLRETAEFKKRWTTGGERYVPNAYWNQWNFLDVLVWPKDPDGNLMDYLYEVAKINEIIEHYITVPMWREEFGGRFDVTYKAFCANFEGECFDNLLTLFHLKNHTQDGLAYELELRKNAAESEQKAALEREKAHNASLKKNATFVDDYWGDWSEETGDAWEPLNVTTLAPLAETTPKSDFSFDRLFSKGEIAKKYTDTFDSRWPVAVRQGKRIPISANIGGTNAITSSHFYDVFKPAYSATKLRELRSMLETSNFIHLNGTQRQLLDEVEDAGGSPLGETKAKILGLMGEVKDGLGKFDVVKAVRFHYASRVCSHCWEASENWLRTSVRFLYGSEEVHPDLQADSYFPARMALSMTKYTETIIGTIGFVFGALLVFTLVVTTRLHRRASDDRLAVDWVRSKTLIGVLSVLGSACAVLTTFGLLLHLGIPFTPTVLIAPYLIVAVGVDDMFVMVSSWARAAPGKGVHRRLAQTLAFSGVPITISSLTDALSFAIGATADIPFLWIFCAYAGTGMIVNYVYQITFLTGCLAVWGDLEASGKHNVTGLSLAEDRTEDGCGKRYLASGSSGVQADPRDRLPVIEKLPKARTSCCTRQEEEAELVSDGYLSRFFYGPYCDKILTKTGLVVAAVLYVLYVAGAAYGLAHLEEGMDAGTLAVPGGEGGLDRDGVDFYKHSRDTFWKEGEPVDILFTKVPDLYPVHNRQAINETIQAFLYQAHTMGEESVWFWLWRFEKYWSWFLASEAQDTEFDDSSVSRSLFYRRLRDTWLVIDAEAQWWTMQIQFASNTRDVACDNMNATFGELCDYYRIVSIRCRIGGRFLRNAGEVNGAMDDLRETADRFPEFGIFVQSRVFVLFYGFSKVQALLLRSLGYLCGTFFVCALLFMPTVASVVLVSAAIASTSAGILGFLSLMGFNVDNVTCIAMLVVAGFAVNLVSHITHATAAGRRGDQRQKVRAALANFGAPIMQGGVSSFLAVLILIVHPYYISLTFFASIFLCVFFGLLHALFFLPVVIAHLPDWLGPPASAGGPSTYLLSSSATSSGVSSASGDAPASHPSPKDPPPHPLAESAT